MDCSPPGSSVHGILQSRIPERVVIPCSRRSSWLRDWTQVFCITGGFFTIWAIRKSWYLYLWPYLETAFGQMWLNKGSWDEMILVLSGPPILWLSSVLASYKRKDRDPWETEWELKWRWRWCLKWLKRWCLQIKDCAQLPRRSEAAREEISVVLSYWICGIHSYISPRKLAYTLTLRTLSCSDLTILGQIDHQVWGSTLACEVISLQGAQGRCSLLPS